MGPGTAATLGKRNTRIQEPKWMQGREGKAPTAAQPCPALLPQPRPLPSLTFFFCLCRARLAALALFKGLGSVLLM